MSFHRHTLESALTQTLEEYMLRVVSGNPFSGPLHHGLQHLWTGACRASSPMPVPWGSAAEEGHPDRAIAAQPVRGSLHGDKQGLIFYLLKLRELDPSNYFKEPLSSLKLGFQARLLFPVDQSI